MLGWRPVNIVAWDGSVQHPFDTAWRKTAPPAASRSSVGVVGRPYPYVEVLAARALSSSSRRMFGRSGIGLVLGGGDGRAVHVTGHRRVEESTQGRRQVLHVRAPVERLDARH